MTEHPIIFSGPMVRAILAGEKTQTRRLVTDQTSQGNLRASELLLDDPRTFVDGGPSPAGNPGPYLHAYVNASAIIKRRGWKSGDVDPSVIERLYPRLFPGDRLWVRESFTLENCREVGWYEPPFNDGRPINCQSTDDDGAWWEQPHYRATDPEPELAVPNRDGEPGCIWKPSIHMPRWASRLTLEVTEVRVQRLQEISEEDAKAEGMEFHNGLGSGCSGYRHSRDHGYVYETAARAFAVAWDSINGKRAPWASNPWVWAIRFGRAPA